MSKASITAQDGIAVISMSCRFPGASDVETFWANLRAGVESISVFSADELRRSGVHDDTQRDPAFVPAGGILEHAEEFDAQLFGFTPREAALSDPQHRVMLECAWEVLERAGYDPDRYDGLIGVFAGSTLSTYLLRQLMGAGVLTDDDALDQAIYENFPGFLTTRISYKFNLRGPSVAVQSACSTGLVAVHLACRSLLDYECDIALAGGVTVQAPQRRGYVYEPQGIVSPDGHCRAFDARGQGTVFGNGAGLVALKRLEDALRDSDTIEAVILGSAVNNDGALKAGFTAPGVEGQAQVVAMAQGAAGVDPRDVTFIEAHGTGTELGDPIEVAALHQVFRPRTGERGFCALGSVKTNVGHLDSAAGIAGLIKAVLALKHATLPPTLHYQTPNPALELDAGPFFVNATARAWQPDGRARIAGVSSFGFGGTNAHVVLIEAPERSATGTPGQAAELIVLSAASAPALDAMSTRLAEFLGGEGATLPLADVAYTLQLGRRGLPYRRALVCRDSAQAHALLVAKDGFGTVSARAPAKSRAVTFMFPGQGAQFAGMGAGLYRVQPCFRRQIDRCAEFLGPLLGADIRTLLFTDADDLGAQARLADTRVTQPALFVVEYALASLWMEWGVRPRSMIGHSIGEYVAACIAGVFGLEEALALVAARGALMAGMPPGRMLAISASEAQLAGMLGGGAELAAVNAPELCVVAGPDAALLALEQRLQAAAIDCRPVRTSHAFHSAMMEPAIGQFTERVAALKLSPPRIAFLSNLTGTWITADQATDSSYWARHLRHTVRFADGIEELLKDDACILLEVGPGTTLGSTVRRRVAPGGVLPVACMPRQGRAQDELSGLLDATGRLWAHGVDIEWAAVNRGLSRRRVRLPTYPFQRRRHWIEARRSAAVSTPGTLPFPDWIYVPSWRRVPLSRMRGAIGNGPWLLFEDALGLGEAVAAALRARCPGASVTRVCRGEGFEEHAADSFTLDPRSPADFEALLERLRANGRIPRHIVHLWNVSGSPAEVSAETVDADLTLGLYSVLSIARAFGPLALDDSTMLLTVVTSGGQSVTASERIAPGRASVAAAIRGIPVEYECLRCRLIDIDVTQAPSGEQLSSWAQQVVEETTRPGDAALVAYRGQARWLASIERLSVTFESEPDRSHKLRQHGVYLITGGLGGIGLVIATYLASACKARLVLIGRSQLPARNQWARLSADNSAPDDVLARIQAIGALQAAGAEVVYATADVADPVAMRQALQGARERFGPLNGVIHAAGVPGGGLIATHSRQRAEQVAAPKVRGAMVLLGLLREEPLDWVMMCSSLAAVLPVAGQIEYAAANGFLDALAIALRAAVPWPVISVGWDRWNEVGMAARAGLPESVRSAVRLPGGGIFPAEGARMFARLIEEDFAVVLVATFDLAHAFDERLADLPDGLQEDAAAQSELEEASAESGQDAAYEAPQDDLQRQICAIWREVLGVARVGLRDDFFALGGDSLIALRVSARLRRQLRAEVSPNMILEAPTVAALASRIATGLRPDSQPGKAADLRARIDQMTPEQIRALLQEKRARGETIDGSRG